ncbi:hypothetical protein LTR05_004449 [Lithohypha guttulata]|uniref:Uncharacterized protein n=1 Tax=Lithohypha guttulata TaxID=1690604 RepID=A0AAN7YGI5_9EURO|nr:hypothetical protein LTR05_004449 [Lithohypha guttulata]
MDPVEGKEDVIIPYQEELSLHDLTGVSVSEQTKPQLARDYALVAGTAEVRYAAGISKHVAFVRGGPVQLIKNWFIIDDDRDSDGPNDLTENGLTVLNQLQSQGNVTNKNVWYNILPEIFVYVRTDDVGVKDPNYQQEFLKNFGLVSPVDTDEAYRDKRLAGRGVTDIFTQTIGRGLLKFKVQLAPADPGPDESVPFTLEMGYELDKKQWSVKEKIYGRLEPHDVNQGVPEEAEETPIERQPFKRYQKRGVGPATPRDTFFPAGVSSTAYIQPGSTTQPRKIPTFADKAFATTGQGAFDSVNQNPFTSTDNTEANVDNMDVDEKLTTIWATRPEIRQAFEEAQQKAKREANRDYDRDTWGANQNNGKHGGGGKHHKHGKHHDRKGVFGKNFKGGNNGHGHGGKHHGAFGDGNHMGRGGNRGGVRGRRGGRGRGRGRGQ